MYRSNCYHVVLQIAGVLFLGRTILGSIQTAESDSSLAGMSAPPDTTEVRSSGWTLDPAIVALLELWRKVGVTNRGDEIPISLDRTSTSRVITSRQIADLPVESLTELLSLQPGVVGAHVRGSRASDMEVYLDGISLRNPMTGYEGQEVGEFQGPSLHSSLGVELPDFAFSQVELLPGGFSSQYGNSGPAVVNITTREGTRKHSGRIRLTTEGRYLKDWNAIGEREWFVDRRMHLPPDRTIQRAYIVDQDGFGYHAGDTLRTGTVFVQGGRLRIGDELVDAAGLREIQANSVLDQLSREYAESTPIWTETQNDYERTKVSYSFSGPLLKNVFYALSGERLDQAKGRYENTTQQNYNILGKLSFNLSPRTMLRLTLLKGASVEGQYFHYNRRWQGGYWPGYGPFARSLDTVNDRFRENSVFTGMLTRSVGPKGQIKLTFGRYTSEFDQKRRDYDDRDGDGDFDEYLVFRKVLVRDGEPGTPDYRDTLLYRYTTEDEALQYIWTQDPTKSDSIYFPNTYDPTYPGEWRLGNTDLVADNHRWSEAHKSGWREVWIPVYDANEDSWSYYSDWVFVTGDNQFENEGEPHSLMEGTFGGTDWYFHAGGDPYRAYLRNASSVTTFKMDYNQPIGTNHVFQAGGEYLVYDLHALRLNMSAISNTYLDEWERQPFEWAVYLGDAFRYKELHIQLGLRCDAFHLGKDVVYSAVADDPDQFPTIVRTNILVEPMEWEGPVVSFSPSFGLSLPRNDRSVYYFHYSLEHRRPDWIYFYQNLDYNDQGVYPNIGNPKLGPIRFRMYELGWMVRPRPDLTLNIALFTRSVSDWISRERGGELPGTKFRIAANSDYGDATGIEFTMSRNFHPNTSLNLYYTFMIAKARLSNPELGETYLDQHYIMPKKMSLSDYNQKHTLQAWLNLEIPSSHNPYLLYGNWKVSVVYRYGSGLPFDSPSRTWASSIHAVENEMRRPHTKTVDLHLAKRVNLFGSVWSVWIDVLNIFNEQNLIAEPDNAEWYLSKEDLDDDGEPDHYRDPEGRYRDWTVWGPGRRVKVGMDIQW